MQVQFDDIGSGACLLRQVGKEEFVNDARTRDADGALLLAGGMGCHHHAARYPLRPHWHARAVVEAAHHLTFWTLLQLIGGQMQTGLDERVIEYRVVFATCQKAEARQIRENGPSIKDGVYSSR